MEIEKVIIPQQTTVNNVYDQFDNLMLSIFLSLRDIHESTIESNSFDENKKNIQEKYHSLLHSLDNLPGVDKNREQLDSDIDKVSGQINNLKQDIKILHEDLITLKQNIENTLDKVRLTKISFPKVYIFNI